MFASCTSLNLLSGTNVDKPPKNLSSVIKDDTLNDPIFGKMPAEVKKYLKSLSSAFKNHDTEFLLDQGEEMFEKIVRPYYDDNEYFCMLYRTGDIARDFSTKLVNINVSEISHIEYTGWESGDPVMEIRGRLFYDDKRFVSCQIMLAWKLDEPKIIGFYP
jgi:hypothetical protein